MKIWPPNSSLNPDYEHDMRKDDALVEKRLKEKTMSKLKQQIRTYAKHTKGPWFVDDTGRHEYGPLIYAERKSGQPLALVYEVTNHKADAALIAAAPDLLEALRQLLSEATTRSVVYNYEIIEICSKAIAKAKGE